MGKRAAHEKRPTVYGECLQRYPDGRCPWASCSRNLMISVTAAGSLVLHHPLPQMLARMRRGESAGGPDVVPDEAAPGRRGRSTETISRAGGRPARLQDIDRRLARLVAWWRDVPTCSSWWAARDSDMTLDEIGSLDATTRERVRQVELGALAKLRPVALAAGLGDYFGLSQGVTIRRRVSSATTPEAQPTADAGDSPSPEGEIDAISHVGVCGDDTR